MSAVDFEAIVYTTIYIGVAGATSVLTQVEAITTEDEVVAPTMPTTDIQQIRQDVQSGKKQVSVNIDFLGDSDVVTLLTRGLELDDDINDPPGFTRYTVFLLGGDESKKQSYLFPSLRTVKDGTLTYSKNKQLFTRVQFIDVDRRRDYDIMFKDTPAAISTILGARSPI